MLLEDILITSINEIVTRESPPVGITYTHNPSTDPVFRTAVGGGVGEFRRGCKQWTAS
jgi:hypothetical protein